MFVGSSGGRRKCTVRANVLRQLLTAKSDPPLRVVALRHVRVTGCLNLEGASLVCPLVLRDCVLVEAVNLFSADARFIALEHCHLPRLVAGGLKVRGDLSLSHSTLRAVDLVGAHIEGELNMHGTTLTGERGIPEVESILIGKSLLGNCW